VLAVLHTSAGATIAGASGSGHYSRHIVLQVADVAVPRGLFDQILQRIDWVRPQPPPLAA
jgi:hypothetical protein